MDLRAHPQPMQPSRLSCLVTYAVALLGLLASFLRIFHGYRSIPVLDPRRLCLVLDEDFSHGDRHSFAPDVDMAGYGNGQFDMSTSSYNNSFVKNNALYILPTLTEDLIGTHNLLDGYLYNLTDCTYNRTTPIFDPLAYRKACSALSNATAGTVINPVQSARLTTRHTASIQYGKVDVVAKLPTGSVLLPPLEPMHSRTHQRSDWVRLSFHHPS
jgi:hypothetical protein